MSAKSRLQTRSDQLKTQAERTREEETELAALNASLGRLTSFVTEWGKGRLHGVRTLDSMISFINRPDISGAVSMTDSRIRERQGLFNLAVWEETAEFHGAIRSALAERCRGMTQPSFDSIDKLRKILHLIRDFFVEEPDQTWFC